MNQCDRCGQEDPHRQCELYELRKKVDKLEEVLGKLAFIVFELEAVIKESQCLDNKHRKLRAELNNLNGMYRGKGSMLVTEILKYLMDNVMLKASHSPPEVKDGQL